jgi:flagellar basal body P-ring protein FlgI
MAFTARQKKHGIDVSSLIDGGSFSGGRLETPMMERMIHVYRLHITV